MASRSASLSIRVHHAHALRVKLQKTYDGVSDRIRTMAVAFTLEIDHVPVNFRAHLESDDIALDMADCVALFRGRFVRRAGKEYYAYMADQNAPRPDDAPLIELYDEVYNLEGNMRAHDLLDCPSCNGCKLIQ
jgi:hypothetical protein